MKRLAAFILAASSLAALFLEPAYAASFAPPTGYVNDRAEMFSAEDRTSLEATLTQFEQETSNEIVVATILSLDGDTIENVAVRMFAEWGIGKEKQDNGVLLLIARDDRAVRIEVGYGLEPVLTDLQASWIIQELITPAFREERYAAGVRAAVQAIMAAAKQEYAIPSAAADAGQIPDGTRNPVINLVKLVLVGLFQFLPFVLFSLFLVARALLGGTRSFWLGGVLGAGFGVVAGYFLSSLMTGLIAAAILGLFGLLIDYLVSRKWKGGGPGFWVGGMGRGGGFGGGGGCGGFGGGSSGGGGASGRW